MEYNKNISNAELILLQLIRERGEASGYDLEQLIQSRGIREWADIGTTSIYNSLKKLEKKKLTESYPDLDKKGKGPVPYKMSVTDAGFEVMTGEIKIALKKSRERDKRFDIGLAGITVIKKREAVNALRERISFLEGEKNRISKKLKDEMNTGIPDHVRLLFEHPLELINTEINFTKKILKTLEKK